MNCLRSFPARSLLSRSLAALTVLALVPALAHPQYAPQAPAPGDNYGQSAPQQQQPGYGQQAYGQPDNGQIGGQIYDQPDGPDYADPQYSQPGPDNAPPANAPMQTQAPLTTEQMEQLVAPIALYPDGLVAQLLAAATYPAQVVDADHWRRNMGSAPADAIVAGANAQSWDPSIKALTAVPNLLAQMDQNIRWTIALGNAYFNEPQQVLDVIQVMRQRAQSAGNLQSGPQEEVSSDQGYIQVAPVDPGMMYLPVYNPWMAYGAPIAPYRGFSFFGALGSFGYNAIGWGGGIAMEAFLHSPFGLLGWGLDWLAHTLLFHNAGYYCHSRTVVDWGLPHGGPRAPYYRGIYSRAGYHSLNYRGYGNRLRAEGYRSPQAGRNGFGGNGGRPEPRFGNGFNTAREQANARQGYGDRSGFAGREGFQGHATEQRFGSGIKQNGLQRGQSGLQQTWNRGAENRQVFGVGRPQQFGNQPAFRAPSSSYGHESFGGARSGGYGGSFAGRAGANNYARPEKSGGSHFSGGDGYKTPKAPKMDHGGGGHFGGGGHSGGGHSGGSHGGGHHH